ncbi:hypothetical protein [Methanohalophilus halophilus]|uniref:Permease n=2 Tax=Methanohalophilus halophilus TaxID=2177 RepID=A0A1H2RAK1_9EURY|nr:hypothetical protein [Methanohalophilus halophilus]SDW16437.1 hypothetical protein SAMN04515625_0485 [Methanohalophilus halophilus]
MRQYYFVGMMIAIYLVVYFTSPTLFHESLLENYSIFLRIIPILALVFVFIFLFNLFLKPDKIKKHLGKEAGMKGWVFSIVAGILSTGPIYVWYPLLSDLKEKGMRTSFMGTFLYNRSVKLPLLPIMIYYFGFIYTLILTIYIILTSIIVGYLTELIVDDESKSN